MTRLARGGRGGGGGELSFAGGAIDFPYLIIENVTGRNGRKSVLRRDIWSSERERHNSCANYREGIGAKKSNYKSFASIAIFFAMRK